jgi:hypothetical protein
MNGVRFTCSILPAGKAGILKPDADGYYTQVLGGLDCYNSRGEYYVYREVLPLFQESSNFMRRVRNGYLKGEVGHPKLLPGMTEQQFIRRVVNIDENNVSHIIRDVWLEKDMFKNSDGRPMVAIMGKIAPTGEKGHLLREAFERAGENVCFSIRSFTSDDDIGLICYRAIIEIVTFDWVTEPGIEVATKFHSPGLESYSVKTLTDRAVARATLERAANDPIYRQTGMEADGSTLNRLLGLYNAKERHTTKPPVFSQW